MTSYDLFPTDYHINFGKNRARDTPEGFRDSVNILGEDFVAVATDVAALHSMCEIWSADPPKVEQMDELDGLQAWIESRLQDLLSTTSDDIIVSCVLAAFLCTYGCWDGVWNSAMLPRILTRRLLECLLECQSRPEWDDHGDYYTGVSTLEHLRSRAVGQGIFHRLADTAKTAIT